MLPASQGTAWDTGGMNGQPDGYGASVGNCLGADVGTAISCGTVRWPAPTWKLGVRVSDDRGDL